MHGVITIHAEILLKCPDVNAFIHLWQPKCRHSENNNDVECLVFKITLCTFSVNRACSPYTELYVIFIKLFLDRRRQPSCDEREDKMQRVYQTGGMRGRWLLRGFS